MMVFRKEIRGNLLNPRHPRSILSGQAARFIYTQAGSMWYSCIIQRHVLLSKLRCNCTCISRDRKFMLGLYDNHLVVDSVGGLWYSI